MEGLLSSVTKLIKLDSKELISRPLYNRKLTTTLQDLFLQITEAERQGCDREYILNHLNDVKPILYRSPFINSLLEWPSGRRGDYQTLEHICDSENRSRTNTLEYFLEEHILQCDMSEQYRNKVKYQSKLILDTIRRRRKKKPSVLSLACCGCRDIRSIVDYLSDVDFELYLMDRDENALAFSKRQLSSIEDRCVFYCGNFFENLENLRTSVKFDLVVIGGIFDALSDDKIGFLLNHLYTEVIQPNGRIFFSSVKTGNPHRAWVEYLTNWFPVERSKEDIVQICSDAGIGQEEISFKLDATKLTWLVEIKKAASKSVRRKESEDRQALQWPAS